MCVQSATTENPAFFSIAHCKHTRYLETPFLVYGMQRYVCGECHPRNIQFFFCIVHWKHTHPRYPETAFLAHGVQRCVCVCAYRAPPQKTPVFFCIAHCKHTHPRYPKTFFSALWCADVSVHRAPPQKTPAFFCLAQCKHLHPSCPQTAFLAHGVQRCAERHPRNPQYLFCKKENGMWNSILASVGSLVQKMCQAVELEIWRVGCPHKFFQPHSPLHPKYHCCTAKPQQKMSQSRILNLTPSPNLTQSQLFAAHLHPLLSMCQVVLALVQEGRPGKGGFARAHPRSRRTGQAEG